MTLKRECHYEGVHFYLDMGCNCILLRTTEESPDSGEDSSYGAIDTHAKWKYEELVSKGLLSDVRPFLPIRNYPPDWMSRPQQVQELEDAWWIKVEAAV